jgi:hypothetical protein
MVYYFDSEPLVFQHLLEAKPIGSGEKIKYTPDDCFCITMSDTSPLSLIR